MQVSVARWGNSLGLRIPKDVADQTGLKAGSRVEIAAKDGRVIISPARPRYNLTDLLRGMTPEAMHEAFDDFNSRLGASAASSSACASPWPPATLSSEAPSTMTPACTRPSDQPSVSPHGWCMARLAGSRRCCCRT